MKFSQFTDYVRWRTKTDTSSLSNANMLLISNIHKNELAKEILKANEDYFVVPATADLVANQREYPFPSDILSQMKALEIKFLASSNYIRAEEIDLNDNKYTTNEASIVNYFDNTNPKYDLIRGSLWIFSGTIPATVAGLKLWFSAYPADFLDMTSSNEMETDPTTTTFGFPKQLHKVLADIVAKDYKIKHGLPMDEVDRDIPNQIQKAIESIENINLDRTIVATLPTGDAIGNDGEDY